MSRILLDADYVIDFLAGRPDVVRTISTLLPQGSSICTVMAAEVLEGVLGGRNSASARHVFDELVQSLEVIDLTMNVALKMAEIRRQLRVSGKLVNHRALDIVIAVSPIEHDLILVTRNPRHFEDIENVRLWQGDSAERHDLGASSASSARATSTRAVPSP